MPFHLNPRATPPRTTHPEQTNMSYDIIQHQGNENMSEGRGQGKVPPKRLTDSAHDRQPNGYREDKDFPRFQRPYGDVPLLDGAHDKGGEYATNKKQTARHTQHLTEDAVFDDEVKGIDGSQSKAFGGHDPNSVIRVGNEMFTTPQEMVQIEKENQEMRTKLLCKMCFVYDAAIVFLPCCHLVCCSACDAKYTVDKCFLCKESTERRIRVQDEERHT